MQDSGSRVQDSGCRGQHSGFGVCLEEIVALLEEVAPRGIYRGILQNYDRGRLCDVSIVIALISEIIQP